MRASVDHPENFEDAIAARNAKIEDGDMWVVDVNDAESIYGRNGAVLWLGFDWTDENTRGHDSSFAGCDL